LVQAEGLAYEIGRYTLHFRPEAGAPVTDVATYLVVHRRQHDGSWRRAAENFTWEAPLTE
jgi:ketosteroid isomerase-like protein